MGKAVGVSLALATLIAVGSIPFVYHSDNTEEVPAVKASDNSGEIAEYYLREKVKIITGIIEKNANNDLLVTEFVKSVKEEVASSSDLLVKDRKTEVKEGVLTYSVNLSRDTSDYGAYIVSVTVEADSSKTTLEQEIVFGIGKGSDSFEVFKQVSTGYPKALPTDQMPMVPDTSIHVLGEISIKEGFKTNNPLYVSKDVEVSNNLKELDIPVGMSPLSHYSYGEVIPPLANAMSALIEDRELLDTEYSTVEVDLPDEGLKVCTGHEVLGLVVNASSLKGQAVDISCGADVNIFITKDSNYTNQPVPLVVTSSEGIKVDTYVEPTIHLSQVDVRGNLHLTNPVQKLENMQVSGALVIHADKPILRLSGDNTSVGSLLISNGSLYVEGDLETKGGIVTDKLATLKDVKITTGAKFLNDNVKVGDLSYLFLESVIIQK